MADLLALQLHRVEDDVRSIVDKAVKELGTEKVGPLGWSRSHWATSVHQAQRQTQGAVLVSQLNGDMSPSVSSAAN